MVSGPVPLPLRGGVDNAVDQVERRNQFIRRHPEVSVTSPRENGTGKFEARWTDGQPHDGVVSLGSHEQLRVLLDWLEARLDRGDLMPETPAN